jgi:hypothetical protein
MNLLPRLILLLTLFWAAPSFADDLLSMDKLSEMETSHLVILGTGVVVGAAVLGPSLGIGELVGALVGVAGGEVIYRTFRHTEYWPFKESHYGVTLP